MVVLGLSFNVQVLEHNMSSSLLVFVGEGGSAAPQQESAGVLYQSWCAWRLPVIPVTRSGRYCTSVRLYLIWLFFSKAQRG